MDFKQITSEQMEAAKNKFLEHGKGVVMNKLVAYEDAEGVSAKWHDLINPSKYAENSIVQRMKNIAVQIKQVCDDPILGELNVAFSHTTELDDTIEFTYEDCYLFLRGALVHRRNTAEYKIKKARISELKQEIEKNKTVTERRKDAKAELAELEKSL